MRTETKSHEQKPRHEPTHPEFAIAGKDWSPLGCVGSFVETTIMAVQLKREHRIAYEEVRKAKLFRLACAAAAQLDLKGRVRCGSGFKKQLTAGSASQ